MNKNYISISIICFLVLGMFQFQILKAQNLKPSIGLSALPADNEPVCSIPRAGNFENAGFKATEVIADFTLYTMSGKAMNIKTELQKKKPVLLVAGNYTCPVYRNRMAELNAIYNKYKDKINIYIIYVVEAHPKTDPSPYSGKEWVTSQNQKDGILYRQPTTYGERKQVAADMLAKMNILPEVLLDGPCNKWWITFGQAPNNAYLIDTNGVVYEKQGWFNKAPQNMPAAIDSLLKGSTNGGGNTNTGGSFSFTLKGDSVITGASSEELHAYGYLKNRSAKAVNIDVVRIKNQVPQGWETAMCIDICLPAEVDSTSLYLNPGDSQLYTMYFYTDATLNNGSATIKFRNRDNPSNYAIQTFVGETKSTTNGINEMQANEINTVIFPNPVKSNNLVSLSISADTLQEDNNVFHFYLYDVTGKIIYEQQNLKTGNNNLDNLSLLPAGLYIYRLKDNLKGIYLQGKLVVE